MTEPTTQGEIDEYRRLALIAKCFVKKLKEDPTKKDSEIMCWMEENLSLRKQDISNSRIYCHEECQQIRLKSYLEK